MKLRQGYERTGVGVIPEDWSTKFREPLRRAVRNGIYKFAEYRGSGTRIVNTDEIFGFDFISNHETNRVSLVDGAARED